VRAPNGDQRDRLTTRLLCNRASISNMRVAIRAAIDGNFNIEVDCSSPAMEKTMGAS